LVGLRRASLVIVGDQLVNDGAAKLAIGLYDENLAAVGHRVAGGLAQGFSTSMA
jgi:hypothetical protein